MSARILIIDDVAANRRLLEAKLACEYYEVLSASRGEEGLILARTEQPDVILLDVIMPGLDGFETCRRLKADTRTRHIPVVLLTALDQREDRIRGLEAGAEDFLSKPFEDYQLFARIRSLYRLKVAIDVMRAHETSSRRLGFWSERENSPSLAEGFW
jgi:two-component system cell cycle response regulator